MRVGEKIKQIRKDKGLQQKAVATAIVHNLAIITSDSDFNNINGLQVIDPSKIS